MAEFDYLMLTLARGAAARRAFAERVRSAGLTDGGRRAGLFISQLGWEAAEVALLAERGDGAALDALIQAPDVVSSIAQTLRPTLRPRSDDALDAGGIYVHRWFEIDHSSLNEFLELSSRGWLDFEARFDARIFGLFELTSAAASDTRQLLLVTRYASHGVWEESRDPTTEAMQSFARRAELTLSTRAASTLLIAP
jgi:hypothetical protein